MELLTAQLKRLPRAAVFAAALALAVVSSRADTFVWNGNGVAGGVANDLLDNPSLLNTWSNSGGPTTTVPGVSDAATIVLSSPASLSQSALLNVGTFGVGNLSGGTIVLTNTNTFANFVLNGPDNVVVSGGITTITNFFTISGGGSLLVNGGQLRLPTTTSNAGRIVVTGGTLTGSFAETGGAPLPSGLVLFWNMDGNANDSSGNALHGTAQGGVGFNTSNFKFGTASAGTFDGINDYIITPNLTSYFPSHRNFTMELWFYPTAGGVIISELGQNAINTGWHDSHLEILGTGQVRIGVWSGVLSQMAIGTATFGQWNYAVIRYNGTLNSLDGFLNGVQSASISVNRAAPHLNGFNQYWALGPNDSTNMGDGTFYNGLIDEFGIYSRPLTNAEIVDRYNFTPSGNIFRNLADAEIQITGGALDVTRSALYNLGTIAVSGSGNAFFGVVGTQTGFIGVENGGILTGTASWMNNGIVKLQNGTVAGTAVVTNNKTLTGTGVVSAPFINAAGAVLKLEGGSLQLTNAASPINSGTILVGANQLVVGASSWTNFGSLIISGGSVRTGGGTGLLTNAGFVSAGSSIDSNFVNTGTLVLTDHTSVTGNFTNAATGRVLPSGFQLTALGGAPITNDGTFIMDGATLTVPGVNQFLNRSTGVIDLNNGALDFSGAAPAFIFTNSGLIQLLGAGSSITGKGATLSPDATSRLRAFTGAVLDLSSAGSLVFNQTATGAGSLEPRGGRIIIDGSITNQGAGGAFINPNNLIGWGTLQVRSGVYSGLSNDYRWLTANGGTLTIETAPDAVIRNVVIGANILSGNSSNTMVFTNSFTFNSTSATNPAHIQLANSTLVVLDGGGGVGTMTTSTGPGAIMDFNNDANENGTIVATVANAGFMRVGNFGGNNTYTITHGFVNLNTGSVQYAGAGPTFTLRSSVTNFGTFHDVRGVISGDIRNVGTWNNTVGGALSFGAAFTNEGQINKSGANTMQLVTTDATTPFSNFGTLLVTGGTLQIGRPGGSGLVALYNFDNNFNDSSGKGLHGTGANGVTFNTTSPKIGSAAGSFDGINDYVVTPNVASLFPIEHISIGVWFNPIPGTGGVIVTELGVPTPNPASHHDSFLEVLSSGEVRARVWNLPYVSLGTANMGTWNYAVLRYDRTTLQLDGFLNGVFSSISTGDRLSAKEATGNEFYGIGMTDSTNLGDGTYFNGFIDQFALFNRPISNTEILAYYNGGAGVVLTDDMVRAFGVATFTNQPGARLRADSGALDLSGVQLVNKATISVASGASAILGLVTDQGGTITVASGGALVATANWDNNGFISLDSSVVRVVSAMSNSGLMLKTGAGAASISGGDGLTANTGTVRITGGTLLVNTSSANMPILQWSLNGNYLDSSGNGNTGVPSGGTGFDIANPKLGSAAGSFNDVNGYIRTPNLTSHFSGNETYSLHLWFLASNAGVIVNENGQTDITSGFRDSHIEILPSGELRIGAYNGSAVQFVSAGIVPFGQWHNVVLRYDKANLRLDAFVNGTFVGSTVFDRMAPFEAGAQQYWSLAASTHGGANMGDATYFGGLIDELAVFNRAITDAEIAAFYNGGAGVEISAGLLQSLAVRTLTNHASGNILVENGRLNLLSAPLVNHGTLALTNNSFAIASTISAQTGTVTVTDSVLAVQSNWTNNGYVALSHGEIRMLNPGDTFYNYNRVSAGSSISGNFFNAGTFSLTDHTSITGNFTNAATGWTTLNGNELQVQGAAGTSNDGTILIGSGTLNSLSGTTNNLGALIQLAGGGVAGGAVENSGSIVGYGRVDAPLTNFSGGSVTASGGTLVFAQVFTNQGNFRVTSFFDVFTELSIDGGNIYGQGTGTFAPSGDGTFSNTQTQAANLGGLYDTRSITMTMASGTVNVEVTSNDVGANLAAIPDNGFSLGTLILPNTLSLLRLMDQYDNEAGGVKDAIYVENLMLGSALTASNFDFGANSLKIYYNHIIGDGGVNFVGTYDGAARVTYFGNIIPLNNTPPPMGVVPEPSTFALLLLGLPLLWLVWRRQRNAKKVT